MLALALGAVVFVAELWAGFRTGSLALLSDAGHVFVDMSGLVLAYFALRIASRPADPQATFGYARAEVIAAAINGLLVIGIGVAIVVGAVQRLRNPLEELDTRLAIIVAIIGLLANALAAYMLHGDAKENINARGAWVNVLGDTFASMGVILAMFLVRWTGMTIWDTIVSFVVAAIIFVASWSLLRGALAILFERAPPHLKPREIKQAVESLPDVVNVHDLHIWTLTPGNHSLTMHVSIRRQTIPRFHLVIRDIEDLLQERFGLGHCTIQVEPEGEDHVSDHYDPVAHRMPEE